jgi:hypothetical protein
MVDSVTIRTADNGGFILEYCTKRKNPDGKTFDNYIHEYKTEVYDKEDIAKVLVKATALISEGKSSYKE